MHDRSTRRYLRLSLRRRQQAGRSKNHESQGQQSENDSLSPFFTEEPIAREPCSENARSNQKNGYESSSDRIVAKATGWIAILTAVLAAIAAVSAVITYSQWHEMHIGSVDTHAVADAAKIQADAANAQVSIISKQMRAWAFAEDVAVYDNIIYQKSGYAHVTLEIKVRNTGQLPAFNTFVRSAIIDATITDDTPEHQSMNICYDEPGATVAKRGAVTVFPGQQIVVIVSADLTREEYVLLKQNPINIWPFIAGCVTYSIVPDGEIHRSGFVYNTFIENDDPKDITLHPSDDPVPKHRVRLRLSPQGAFAD